MEYLVDYYFAFLTLHLGFLCQEDTQRYHKTFMEVCSSFRVQHYFFMAVHGVLWSHSCPLSFPQLNVTVRIRAQPAAQPAVMRLAVAAI